jgi:hypothetical protein
MRIPVFARGSNPAIDRPNQRKSENYGQEEVDTGRADWIDAADHSQGILCRAFLYSGETLKPAQPEQLSKLSPRSLPPLEVRSTQFDDPEKSPVKRSDRICLVVRAQAFARFCDLEVFAEA